MGATLIEVQLPECQSYGGKLSLRPTYTNANFEGANLIGATWTNGETCGPNSIGTCNK